MTISQTLIDQMTDELKQQITEQNFEHEKQKIIHSLDPEVYRLLQECNTVLAGGAITSIFSGNEINDWDIYFKDKQGFSRFLFAAYGRSISDGDVGIYNLRINHFTKRSILLISLGQEIQAVGMETYESIEDVFNLFDFTVCMGAYDFKSERFTLHPDFMKHNSQRKLFVNTNTRFPLVSVLRVDKYRKKGYDISKAQMMRLLMAVNRKNINSWEIIEDELGGLYGLNPEDVLDKTKEFSLDEAMEQLGRLFVPSHYAKINVNPDLSKLIETFDHMIEDKVKEFVNKDPYSYYGEFDFELN